MKLNKYISQKKGRVILRDIVLITLILSAVLVFASTFVTQMANNYGLTNMSDEYGLASISMSTTSGLFNTTAGNITDASGKLQAAGESKGLWGLVAGFSEVTVTIIKVFLTAPNQVGNLVKGILQDYGVAPALTAGIQIFITMILWAIVIFSVLTAFRAGSEI